MTYNKKDLRKKMDTVIDASILLHKYIQYLEEQSYTADCISEKDYYKREANKARKISNDLNNMYDDYATVYYYMEYDSISEVRDDILQSKN